MSGPDESGLVRLEGRARPSAWVFAIDKASQVGVFAAAETDGRYLLELRAAVGDEIVLWYEVNGEGSEPLSLIIEAP